MEPHHFTAIFNSRDGFVAFAKEGWVRMLDDGHRPRDGVDVWVSDGLTIVNMPEECCSECVVYGPRCDPVATRERLQQCIKQVSSAQDKYSPQFIRSFCNITAETIRETALHEGGTHTDMQVRMRCPNVPFQCIDEAMKFWTQIFAGLQPFDDSVVNGAAQSVTYHRSMFTLIDEEYNEIRAVVDEYDAGHCKLRLVAGDAIAADACRAKLANTKQGQGVASSEHAESNAEPTETDVIVMGAPSVETTKDKHDMCDSPPAGPTPDGGCIALDSELVQIVIALIDQGSLDKQVCCELVQIVDQLSSETDAAKAGLALRRMMALVESASR